MEVLYHLFVYASQHKK